MRRQMTVPAFTGLIFLVSLLALPASAALAGQSSPVSVISVGPPRLIYDTARDGCNQNDFPDEVARAFRDSKGTIHLFATTSVNRAMLGPNFESLRHTCDVAFKGALNANPAAYDDNGWMTAFWASGETVFTLIHNEFHGSERQDFCPPQGGANCIEVSITEAISRDGGYHFRRFPGESGLVADLPYTFRPVRNRFFGYLNPSNIVKKDGFFYVLVSAIDPYDRAHNGVCILRSSTLEPKSWRAWDGRRFNKTFADPYQSSEASPEENTCTPITKDFFYLGSILYSPTRKEFLLVSRVQKWDHPKHGETPGAYLWQSEDLIHWAGPILLLSDAQAGGIEQLYPCLIDPSAQDQNFTTVGSSALLFTKIGTPGEGLRGSKLVARRVTLR